MIQFTDLSLESIGAPDWVVQTIIPVLVPGLLVVVFFSWPHEVTPEGIKRESEVDRSRSITHVNGSGRLHTVREEINPLYYQVIRRFYELTGVPMVVNTSFNVRGQPIVNTPREALATFFTSGLDALVIDRFLVEKA